MTIQRCRFRPIDSEYKPIGQLYRQMAKDICINCGGHRDDHPGWWEQEQIDKDELPCTDTHTP